MREKKCHKFKLMYFISSTELFHNFSRFSMIFFYFSFVFIPCFVCLVFSYVFNCVKNNYFILVHCFIFGFCKKNRYHMLCMCLFVCHIWVLAHDKKKEKKYSLLKPGGLSRSQGERKIMRNPNHWLIFFFSIPLIYLNLSKKLFKIVQFMFAYVVYVCV